MRALDRSLVSSIAWTGAAKWAVQVLSWACTVLVVRLLTPAQYGIFGMAAVVVGILQLACEFGVGAAIVQGPNLTREQAGRLSGFAVSLGVACWLVAAAIAGPVAEFFGEPALRAVVPVMGLTFFFGSFRTVPAAMLSRELRFRRLAAVETGEALCLTLTTVGLALAGYGYWSLVIGSLVSKVAGSTLAALASPQPIAIPLPFGPILRTVHFGAYVALSTLAWYAYSNADRAVVGRMLGEAALGAYAIGTTLASMPVDKISQLYQRVSEAVIARVQHDPVAVARYLLRITEGVAMVSFPLSIGMALVADQFVHVVLGPHWEPAILPLRLLAVAAALRSLDPLLAQLLIATGHASDNARSMTIAAIVMPVGFLLGAHWGLAGVAAVWLIGHPAVVMTRQVWCALRIADARLSDYLAALWPSASSAALMALAVLGTRALLDPATPPPIALAIAVSTGALAYTLALVVLHGQRVRAAWQLVRRNRGA